MPNSRTYSIVINGVNESISAVDSLLKKLNELESRINSLSGSSVGVSASGGKGGGNASALSAEEKVQKKIQTTVEKIAEARTKDYQTLQQAKADLKEIEKAQKSVAAAQRISGDEAKQYANTLDGQRQKLADMKIALGSKELGSADFEKQVRDINELNNKILSIEKSYGQFGRNVGNYASGVAEGMQKIKMTVNGATREFSSARDASRTLGNELKTMAVQGKQNTEEYKELERVFKQLQSTMKDVSRSSQGMDLMLDTMQSITAIGSVGRGFAAIFGFDNSEIQKSIQQLMALQAAMQGLETLRKQMTTGEGLGKIFRDISTGVDGLTGKINGASGAMAGLGTTTQTTSTAVKTLNTALKAGVGGLLIAAIATAIEKLTSAFKHLYNGVKLLAGMGGDILPDWAKNILGLKEEKDELLAFEMTLDGVNSSLEEQRNEIDRQEYEGLITKQEAARKKAIATQKAMNDMTDAYKRLKQEDEDFDLSFSITDLSLPQDWAARQFESFAKWASGAKNAELTFEQMVGAWNHFLETGEKSDRDIGKLATTLKGELLTALQSCNLETEQGIADFQRIMRMIQENAPLMALFGQQMAVAEGSSSWLKSVNGKMQNTLQQAMWAGFKQINNDLNTKEKPKKSSGAAKAAVDAVSEMNKLRIRAMNEGLQKTLAQIKENERKEIKELKIGGKQRAEAMKLIEQYYARERQKAIDEDYKKRLEAHRKYQNELLKLESETLEKQADNIEKETQNAVDAFSQNFDIPKNAPVLEKFFGSEEDIRNYVALVDKTIVQFTDSLFRNKTAMQSYWWSELNKAENLPRRPEILRYIKRLGNASEEEAKNALNRVDALIEEFNKKRRELLYGDTKDSGMNFQEQNQKLDELTRTYKKQINDILHSFGGEMLNESAMINRTLGETVDDYINVRERYYREILQKERENGDKLYQLRKENIEKTAELEQQALDDQINERFGSVDIFANVAALIDDGKLDEAKNMAADLGGSIGKAFAEGSVSLQRYQQLFDEFIQKYQDKLSQINSARTNSLFGLDIETAKRESSEIAKMYEGVSDAMSTSFEAAMHQFTEIQRGGGVFNITQTRKDIKEVIAIYEDLKGKLQSQLTELRRDFADTEINLGTEDFEREMKRIISLIYNLDGAIAEAKQEIKNGFSKFLQSLMPYLSEVVNGISGILSELSNLYSAQSENRMKLLEKENERLQELYDKQEEIEQRHRDNLNTIEDEISNARGARREFLVDQYNAEIDAQRRAVAEKKRLDEELKRNQKKQEQEEKELRKKQNKIQMAQATMSAAMAVINAYATQPWAVGQVLGPIALALTSAQLVIMSKAMKESEKYAEGGKLVGKSHKQGGIKVLGGQAEVEGGEYIINKKTTSLNEPVIEFINSKKQRLELGDFIDFYSSKSAKKQIKNNLKHKFADGGALPAANISRRRSLSEQLIDLHPVVAVTDIINETDAYNRVRVLAGDAE